MKVEPLKPICLSLFDWSGNWSRPYAENGYRVLLVDIKWGIDIMFWNYEAIPKDQVKVILAAPPCTDFCIAGARFWKQKDEDGVTEKSCDLVAQTLEIIDYFQPPIWALENPVGRLPTFFSRLGKPWYFHPWEFGDAYTKKTCLWGQFNIPKKNPVKPIMYTNSAGKRGSFHWACLGGKSEKTKEIRSLTPAGFSKAFFEANH